MHNENVVDASGLFGPRHRMRELLKGKLKKIEEYDQFEAIVLLDNKLS